MRVWTGTTRRLLASLVLAFGVASCDHAPTPMDVDGPQEVSEEPQELLGLFYPSTVQAIDQYGNIGSYELVREPILSLDLRNLRVSDLIGVNGGSITLLGHSITVPRGAVSQPTLFTLIVLPTGYVQVDASALVGSVLGGLLNIGEQGFNKPVRLQLSYERARVSSRDEDDLLILRLNPRGINHLHQVMPSTVNERNETVTTWLEHFSGYCMAM